MPTPITDSDHRPTGVLLLNLGTPDSPEVPDVRRYLREFLSDPRVIDINPVGRWLLLNLVILRFRPAQSARAYKLIWGSSDGSPLLAHSRRLADGVRQALGNDHVVELAMRYGNPSIPDALARLDAAQPRKIVVVPLFPQYSSAATGSAIDRVYEVAGKAWNVPPIETVGAFYDDHGFIDAFAEVARRHLAPFRADHVLFSYHGLPERHVKKSDATGGRHCLAQPTCCDAIVPANRYCYRAQCYATTRALAARLGLPPERHGVSFQSRLGRTPWIRPYTDHVLPELARAGKKRLAVMCPAFVADCLETVEEIGIRARDQWRSLGGEELLLVPSLNAEPAWIRVVAQMVRDRTTAVAAGAAAE